MGPLIKSQTPFLLPYGIILLLGAYLSAVIPQADISIKINAYHNDFLDIINSFGTYLGDGFWVVFIGIGLFFYDKKLGLTIILAYAISSGLVQLLKHTVFSDYHRPMYYLSEFAGIHPVEGIELNYHNSFPSGHTTAAFSIYSVLAFYVRNPYLKFAFLLLAVFVAFTRIYLLQHFFIDTLVGSLFGFTFGALFFYLIFNKNLVLKKM
ncbi:MAG: phosphatase PAP2 family protein [Bacteroidia bacterium]